MRGARATLAVVLGGTHAAAATPRLASPPCNAAGTGPLCNVCHVCRNGRCVPAPEGTPCSEGRVSLHGVCGPIHDPGPCPAAGPSGIDGEVVLAPPCLTTATAQPCPDVLRPFAADLRIEDATGGLYCTTKSGADGQFRAALPPGDYIVDPVDPNPGGPPHGISQPVTVRRHRDTAIAVRFVGGLAAGS